MRLNLKLGAVVGALLACWMALPGTGLAQELAAGGSESLLVVVKGGVVKPLAGTLLEAEYQFPWGGTDLEPAHQWGGLVAYVGAAADGDAGSTMPGMGYRHYVRAGDGSVYPGIGFAVFSMGRGVGVDELTVFAGLEVLLEVEAGSEEAPGKVTGVLGVYPEVAGGDGELVARAGVRFAL